jgi:hypothetical protein
VFILFDFYQKLAIGNQTMEIPAEETENTIPDRRPYGCIENEKAEVHSRETCWN